MKKKWLIGIVIIIILMILGFGYQWKTTQNNEQQNSLSGNVDIREVNLSFRVPGRLKTLAVDEGASVRAGQVLGELDPVPYQIALQEAKANEATASARLALYKEGFRQEDKQQAKAEMQAAQATLILAQKNLQRQQTLAQNGASAKRLLDEAQAQSDQATAKLKAASEHYQALAKGYRLQEIRQVEAQQQQAAAAWEQAKLHLADTVLKAPSDGIIITRAMEPGSLLNAGQNVLTLSLVHPVWVRAYVPEPQLGQAAPGTRVKVYSDSNSKPYDGVVGFVSPTAEFTPKNVETKDLRTALVYRLRVIVNNPDSRLRQGMPVTVKLPS